MRSRQLALCAAVAACAVTTAPAYGMGARGTGTGRTLAAAAPYATYTPYVSSASGSTVARQVTGCHAAWDAACSAVLAAAAPPVRPAGPLTADEASLADSRPAADAGPRRELSSTSAVGLVLAGGAVLVIAGQLLRLRLRLRRTRRGDVDEH
ncbi:hypothetical protein SAMN06272775_4474 [Streptomyces sp. 2323.1]|uniref:hypothetical protein n=1 Tax=Streptomyces sp. 2323.1 TaxID=1938841 RepID=UPI000BBFDA0F|nr:hypothetical protein [Streptomyces sp. 2323.1]SOE13495.1 hypothetical protein SAMN06272775_4474 [Streptomyces sp. 2323.1]